MITYLVDSSYPAKYFGKILMWEKLSNSGDILKLIVPNYPLKRVCGWTNHSCKVISYKMSENEMGNRGSKSVFLNPQPKEISVKEKRVDGSCFGYKPKLRCTLMGGESYYQVKNLSKRLNNKQFSTLTPFVFAKRSFALSSTMTMEAAGVSASAAIENYKLNPWFVSGFIDGEGTFAISIWKDNEYKLGWQICAEFSIQLHKRDLNLLLQLQDFFSGTGLISISKTRNSVTYSVKSIKDVTTIIIPHFSKYKLLTQKAADFIYKSGRINK